MVSRLAAAWRPAAMCLSVSLPPAIDPYENSPKLERCQAAARLFAVEWEDI